MLAPSKPQPTVSNWKQVVAKYQKPRFAKASGKS